MLMRWWRRRSDRVHWHYDRTTSSAVRCDVRGCRLPIGVETKMLDVKDAAAIMASSLGIKPRRADSHAAAIRTKPGLELDAASLWHKHGFNDGDCPFEVFDLICERYGGAWSSDPRIVHGAWQKALLELVQIYLLPVLNHKVTLAKFWDDSSNHNPCRAAAVDGRPLTDDMGEPISGAPSPENTTLLPESVMVPWDVVMATLERIADQTKGT